MSEFRVGLYQSLFDRIEPYIHQPIKTHPWIGTKILYYAMKPHVSEQAYHCKHILQYTVEYISITKSNNMNELVVNIPNFLKTSDDRINKLQNLFLMNFQMKRLNKQLIPHYRSSAVRENYK